MRVHKTLLSLPGHGSEPRSCPVDGSALAALSLRAVVDMPLDFTVDQPAQIEKNDDEEDELGYSTTALRGGSNTCRRVEGLEEDGLDSHGDAGPPALEAAAAPVRGAPPPPAPAVASWRATQLPLPTLPSPRTGRDKKHVDESCTID